MRFLAHEPVSRGGSFRQRREADFSAEPLNSILPADFLRSIALEFDRIYLFRVICRNSGVLTFETRPNSTRRCRIWRRQKAVHV